jgi:hypothetical protein
LYFFVNLYTFSLYPQIVKDGKNQISDREINVNGNLTQIVFLILIRLAYIYLRHIIWKSFIQD